MATDGFFINVQEDPGEGDNKSELKINIFVPPGGAALDIEKAFEKAYAENEDLFWGFYGIKLSDDKTDGKKSCTVNWMQMWKLMFLKMYRWRHCSDRA